jgi:hypothetical protein
MTSRYTCICAGVWREHAMRVLRSAGAIVAGFIVASIVMMIFESLNGRVLYPELAKAAQGVTDREVLRSLLASAPSGAFLVVIAGWLVGSVAGGWLAALTAGRSGQLHGLLLGLLLTLAGIANNLMLPPPLWFWIVSLIVLLPSACFGARLAARG